MYVKVVILFRNTSGLTFLSDRLRGSLRSFAYCYIFKHFFWLIAIFVAFGNYTGRSSLLFGLSSRIDAHLFDTHEHQQ